MSPQSMRATYVSTADPCHPLREALVGTQDHFSSKIAEGIFIGVLTGITTELLAGSGKNRERNAFRNAVLGGIAGAAGGYLRAKAERAKDREDLRQAISSDVHRDTGKVTEMGSILRRLNACRREQVAAVERQYRDESLTAEQARAELKMVRASVESDNTLIGEILGEVTKRKAVYVESISHVEKKTEDEVLGEIASYQPADSSTPAPATRYFAAKDSNVRAQPSTEASVLGVLPENASVEVVGPALANDKWYEVRYMDKEAFVFAELLDTKKAQPSKSSNADVAARPKAENDVQELELVSREVSAEQEMASAELVSQIDARIDEIEEMLAV